MHKPHISLMISRLIDYTSIEIVLCEQKTIDGNITYIISDKIN